MSRGKSKKINKKIVVLSNNIMFSLKNPQYLGTEGILLNYD